MNKYSIFVLLFFVLSVSAHGQVYRQEKRIYLVDVTASMAGKGNVPSPDIFDGLKNQLAAAVSGIVSDDTEVLIIPFTDRPHMPISGNTSNKESLISQIRSLEIRNGDTNIADAWVEGVRQIDSAKVNYLFLLTDGLHNCGPEKDVLFSRLLDWATYSCDNYYFAFYVMLTPNAREIEIADIVKRTDKMWLIESMDVTVSFINTGLTLSVNINKGNKVRLPLSSNNYDVFNSGIEYHIELEDNPYYKISGQTIISETGELEFEISELKPHIWIPVELTLSLSIVYDKEKYPLVFFTPEVIRFNIINRGVRKMTIKER